MLHTIRMQCPPWWEFVTAKCFQEFYNIVNTFPGAQAVGNTFSRHCFSIVRGVVIKHVAPPPITLSIPNTLNDSSWCISIRAPMYGAVSNQILAHMMQETTKIFRFSGLTNSVVHENNIDWEHDTAIFGMIAVSINRPTLTSGDTVRYTAQMKIWKKKLFF